MSRSDASLVSTLTPPLAEWLQTSEAGGGRIVRIAPGGPPPAYHCLLPYPQRGVSDNGAYYENQFSLLSRVMLWLARREPECWVTGLESLTPGAPGSASRISRKNSSKPPAIPTSSGSCSLSACA